MSDWIFANPEGTVANRANDDGSIDSRSILDPEIAAWIAAGNTPGAYVPPAEGGLQEF